MDESDGRKIRRIYSWASNGLTVACLAISAYNSNQSMPNNSGASPASQTTTISAPPVKRSECIETPAMSYQCECNDSWMSRSIESIRNSEVRETIDPISNLEDRVTTYYLFSEEFPGQIFEMRSSF